jgi:nucleoside 2-deoxyribosyltransferase
MADLRAFVGHGFGDKLYAGGIASFRRKVRAAVKAAERSCKRQGVDITLIPFFVSQDYGRGLPGVIREALESSSIGVFDLTGLRPNVLYEMGYFVALARPSVLIMRQGTKLPADMADVLAGVYRSESELPSLIASRLEQAIMEVRSRAAGRSRTSQSIWFPYDPPVIAVVCAPEPERSRFASRAEANYLFIDNLEDRDALFEVATYLARTFPECRVDRCASDSIVKEALSGDLVVIGGPGEPSGPGNQVCRDLLKMVKGGIGYSDACDRAFFRSKEYVPEFDSNRQLCRDYGYFLRERNPFNSDRTVIVMSGVYTAGTLGAALAFSDHPQGQENAKLVRSVLGVRPGEGGCFEAFFPVEVYSGGTIACPRISARQIISR